MSSLSMWRQALMVIFITLFSLSFNLNAAEDDTNREKPKLKETNEESRTVYLGVTAAADRAVSKHDSEIGLSRALSEILKDRHIKVEIRIYANEEALSQALESNKIYGFWGTALEALERLDILIEPIITKKSKGASIKQPLLVLSNKNNPALTISELKGKKLLLPQLAGIERLFINTQLLKNGQPESDQFFINLPEVKNPNLAVMDVYFGHADVTILKLQDYQTALKLNPQLANKIKIIEQSPPYLITVAGVTKFNDKTEALALMDEVIEGAKRPETNGFLSLINADSLEYIGYKDFDSLLSLLNEYKQLKKQSTKKANKK